MDDMFERSANEHNQIHKVLAKHPDGGDWQEFQSWMGEAK
jgi:hypothetical protein